MLHVFIDDDNLRLIIFTHNPREVWQVKQLPGRVLDPETGAWVVPVRPGLSKTIERIYGAVVIGEFIEPLENVYLDLLSPPEPGSVNPWRVPAVEAVELAVEYHFYLAHGGNNDEYLRHHTPYMRGE